MIIVLFIASSDHTIETNVDANVEVEIAGHGLHEH